MTEPDPASSLCFVDTNIWLYAFIDGPDVAKSERARQLLSDNEHSLVVSSQVINEICVNLLKKAHVPEAEVQQLIHSFYQSTLSSSSINLCRSALRALRERFSLSFWDSLILAAAVHCGATILYSEDMQAGLKVDEGLTIQNPFLS